MATERIVSVTMCGRSPSFLFVEQTGGSVDRSNNPFLTEYVKSVSSHDVYDCFSEDSRNLAANDGQVRSFDGTKCALLRKVTCRGRKCPDDCQIRNERVSYHVESIDSEYCISFHSQHSNVVSNNFAST